MTDSYSDSGVAAGVGRPRLLPHQYGARAGVTLDVSGSRLVAMDRLKPGVRVGGYLTVDGVSIVYDVAYRVLTRPVAKQGWWSIRWEPESPSRFDVISPLRLPAGAQFYALRETGAGDLTEVGG